MKYSNLVEVYQKLESTTKRLEKTFYLSEFLRIVNEKDIDKVILLIQGKIFPDWDQRVIGVASRILVKAINTATGASVDEIEKIWKKTGDLGDVAQKLCQKKSQSTLFSQELTVSKVFENIRKVAELEGQGTVANKIQLIAELLTSSSAVEAKYIIRIILGDLRVGLGEGTIRDAIVWAYLAEEKEFIYDKENNELIIPENNREKYNKLITTVQEAYDIANDFSVVAQLIKKSGLKGLENIELSPGKPIKVMLYQKAKNIEEAFETVGKPAAIEQKYDGFRMQIHKSNNKIIIFTRRLENVTNQFPDVVEFVKNSIDGNNFIIDGEAVGYDVKTEKYIAFQNISQRIRRKYDIHEVAEKFPVELNLFDIVFFNNKNLIKKPFIERRKILEKITKEKPKKIKLAEEIITEDIKEAEIFYKKSLDNGNEGIMIKNLQGIYKPGSRVGYGVKVKPTMETLEVVIVGAEWGEGKRSAWLSSFVIACKDPETNQFLEIGRVGTGIKEKEEEGVSFNQLTKLLKPLITEDKGREIIIKPEIVIEVNYEEIQKSPTYTSGFALRFPRLVKLREDRSPKEINTIEDVKKMYKDQRGRS